MFIITGLVLYGFLYRISTVASPSVRAKIRRKINLIFGARFIFDILAPLVGDKYHGGYRRERVKKSLQLLLLLLLRAFLVDSPSEVTLAKMRQASGRATFEAETSRSGLFGYNKISLNFCSPITVQCVAQQRDV